MREHGILGVADEGLDLEVLFDPTEEDCDLPALFIDVGDGLGYQPKVVGEKDINFPGGKVPVNNVAQRFGALPGFGAGKQNGLVGHQPQGGIDWPGFQHPVAGIALLPGDKEDFLGREVTIPGIISVAQVFHHDGTVGQVQGSGFLHLMLPGGGDGHKGRQVPADCSRSLENRHFCRE